MKTCDVRVSVQITLTKEEMLKASDGHINGSCLEAWLWSSNKNDYLHYFEEFDDSSLLITVTNTTEAKRWLKDEVHYFLSNAEV